MADLLTPSEDLKSQLLHQFAVDQTVDFQVSITAYDLDWINFEVKDCTKGDYVICKGSCSTSGGYRLDPREVLSPLADYTVFTIPQLYKINCFVEDFIRKLQKERRCLA